MTYFIGNFNFISHIMPKTLLSFLKTNRIMIRSLISYNCKSSTMLPSNLTTMLSSKRVITQLRKANLIDNF